MFRDQQLQRKLGERKVKLHSDRQKARRVFEELKEKGELFNLKMIGEKAGLGRDCWKTQNLMRLRKEIKSHHNYRKFI